MTLRSNDPTALIAHSILDDIRAGLNHSPRKIAWALRVLGEPVGA